MENEQLKLIIEKHYNDLANEIHHHIKSMLGQEPDAEWVDQLDALLKEQREKLELRVGV